MSRHPWYDTARWKALRMKTLVDARFTCAMCGRVHHDPSRLVADHVVPHRGDERLFWEGELQALCGHPCHGRHKQAAEVRGYDDTIGADGWPVDPCHPANARGGSISPGGGKISGAEALDDRRRPFLPITGKVPHGRAR